MNNIIKEFERYCYDPKHPTSNKPNFYAKSIKYLCDFLNITVIDDNIIEKFKNLQSDIENSDSWFYKNFLSFLAGRHQESYLADRFVRRALNMFFSFYKISTAPEIRIVSMQKNEFENDDWYDGMVESIQDNYFLDKLLYADDGKYFVGERKIASEKNALLLFSFNNEIIASATFIDVTPKGEKNALIIDKDSVKVFKPISADELKKAITDFKGFGRMKPAKFGREYLSKVKNLIESKQLKIPPLFFANITWMERYDGPEVFKKPGATYVKDKKDAGEKNNFKEIDGKFYGFVECVKNKKINIDTIAKRYGCVIKETESNRCIENALVVFFSTPPKGTARIVGFYKNAIIYENHEINDKTNNWYYFTCNSDDGVFIDEKNRHFKIPKKENDIFYYGQDQRWYADKDKYLPLIIKVIRYIENYTELETSDEKEDEILSKALKDSDIEVEFDKNKINGELPTNDYRGHNYNITRTNGTSKEGIRNIFNGRKAEKYFIDFLIKNGFVKGKDFYDVANNKNYGYDVEFFNIGIEVKNIKSGSFYLTDNEIAHLENGKTNLILISIGSGIWFMKNNSIWLKNQINKIKSIRGHCENNYSNIVLTDIKINITNDINTDIFEISQLNKDKIANLIRN